jgi:HAD superfamily phosphoserine phosphatase-like hydrolase
MKINLYDFDNTIYKGDSSTDFFFYSLMRKPIIIVTIPRIIIRAIKYKLGIINKTTLKEAIFQFLKYIDTETYVRDFWNTHRKYIKDFYKTTNHESDIIISASPEFLLKPICKELKVKDLIGSIVDENTGKFTGLNCHDEEKVRRLNKKYKNYTVINAYTDSKSDIPILRLATNQYIVRNNKIIPSNYK